MSRCNSHIPMSGGQALSSPMLGVMPCEYADELETRFDLLHFCRRLYMSISIVLRVVSCKYWQTLQKIPKEMSYICARSFRVIEFSTSRKGIYDFLLINDSNFDYIVSKKLCQAANGHLHIRLLRYSSQRLDRRIHKIHKNTFDF